MICTSGKEGILKGYQHAFGCFLLISFQVDLSAGVILDYREFDIYAKLVKKGDLRKAFVANTIKDTRKYYEKRLNGCLEKGDCREINQMLKGVDLLEKSSKTYYD